MQKQTIHIILTCLIAAVWVINGLICKVLNLVPRHQLIVARILGDPYSGIMTRTIGVLEILMAIWVLSSIKSRLCTLAQIVIVAAMNAIEYYLAPDLLLFGKFNALIALFFIAGVFYNDSALGSKRNLPG